MQTLQVYDEQVSAIADAFSYYSDYGCGDQRPLTAEQKEHIMMIKGFQEQLNAKLEVLDAD